MTDFKQNPQAKLRLPEEVRRDERAARREPEKPADEGTKTPPPYLVMACVVKSTVPVMLWQDDTSAHECVWRVTRTFNKNLSKWDREEFWAMVNSRNTPIDFEPIGWSRV